MSAGLIASAERASSLSGKAARSTVVVFGSGGLRIGQAGEFDYSGSQAIKALKEENYRVVLINPNIATVQTDPGLADEVYLQPLTVETAEAVFQKERPDALLLGFGGQTALNLGLELFEAGLLETYRIEVLGTPLSSIKITEDRALFKEALEEIGVETARSFAVSSPEEALSAARELGYPLMLRSGYSLGGQGSGRAQNEAELELLAREALSSSPQILIEEYLEGWKEIEYEVMRDSEGNCITVCNMENLDPMGIHTGESLVVAPSQTLDNAEYHRLRKIALETACHLGIVGECNIQYALHPQTGQYRVIEVNARLSRSSALASKATGYPIAFVAAKLAAGKKFYELKNEATGKTSAFFEPALDYVVVKMPRWDMQKFKAADRKIGSEMKSVGEVMAIGRSFPEALQKAVRMLNIGLDGLGGYEGALDLQREMAEPTEKRLYALYRYFLEEGGVEEAHLLTRIDPWFLAQILEIAEMEKRLARDPLSPALLLEAKRCGFSDRAIGRLKGEEEAAIREKRKKASIVPFIKQIDTLAAEFKAQTSYLYMTYWGSAHDLEPSEAEPILILGSGPYCIGSSVEFDWCAVNALKAFRREGHAAFMINSNPETVSTDYDESDRLYFEELTFERVADIAEFESPKGLVVSVGGQIANNLALPLHRGGFPLLGSSACSIDLAENRRKFSTLLQELSIDQPAWTEAKSLEEAERFVRQVGYPVLVRPSYVLSGAAMNVVYSERELEEYLSRAVDRSGGHPVVLSQFIEQAKELEIDGVAERGEVIVEAISEHIENAGVHSGDATLVLPPQRLYLETIRRAKEIARKIAAALSITGPFNIQFIAKDNALKVIECNVRASRSFPFVSKVTNVPYMELVAQALLGAGLKKGLYETLELNCIGVKTPQFSYHRLKGSNPVAQVEMASTGEVACLGESLEEAFFQSWLATEQKIRGKSLLVSLGGDKKKKFLEALRALEASGWELSATEHTHDFLVRNGIGSRFLYKASEELEPNVKTVISRREVDLIVNIPSGRSRTVVTDGFVIRRLAVDHHIPLMTNLQTALLFLHCLRSFDQKRVEVKSWKEFMQRESYARFVSPAS